MSWVTEAKGNCASQFPKIKFRYNVFRAFYTSQQEDQRMFRPYVAGEKVSFLFVVISAIFSVKGEHSSFLIHSSAPLTPSYQRLLGHAGSTSRQVSSFWSHNDRMGGRGRTEFRPAGRRLPLNPKTDPSRTGPLLYKR